MRVAVTALALVLLAPPALAGDPPATSKPAPAPRPAPKAKPKKQAPQIILPSLGEIPSADGVQRSSRKDREPSARTAPGDATYQVIAITHAKAFKGSQAGAVPVTGALEVVKVRGDPRLTEKFASVIRVRSPQREGAEIEVAILDPRGTTTLSASGTLSWRGASGDDTEWQVDWDPSPVPGPGPYQVLVRIAGRPMGTWPLTIAAD